MSSRIAVLKPASCDAPGRGTARHAERHGGRRSIAPSVQRLARNDRKAAVSRTPRKARCRPVDGHSGSGLTARLSRSYGLAGDSLGDELAAPDMTRPSPLIDDRIAVRTGPSERCVAASRRVPPERRAAGWSPTRCLAARAGAASRRSSGRLRRSTRTASRSSVGDASCSSPRCRSGSSSRSCTGSTTATRSAPTTRRSTTSSASSLVDHDRCLALLRRARRSPTRRPGASPSWSRSGCSRSCSSRSPRDRARDLAAASDMYMQNTVIVGAGDVGQLSPASSSSIRSTASALVGFVDRRRGRCVPISADSRCSAPRALPELVASTTSTASSSRSRATPTRRAARPHPPAQARSSRSTSCRACSRRSGPRAASTRSRALPLIGLPRRSSSRSRARSSGRSTSSSPRSLLLVTAPLFAYIASGGSSATRPGPVFFRQTRLGLNMRAFTRLKFRTMRVDTDDAATASTSGRR